MSNISRLETAQHLSSELRFFATYTRNICEIIPLHLLKDLLLCHLYLVLGFVLENGNNFSGSNRWNKDFSDMKWGTLQFLPEWMLVIFLMPMHTRLRYNSEFSLCYCSLYLVNFSRLFESITLLLLISIGCGLSEFETFHFAASWFRVSFLYW